MSHLTLYFGGDQEIMFAPDAKPSVGSGFHILKDLGDSQSTFEFLSKLAVFLKAEYGTATRRGANAPKPLKYSCNFCGNLYRKTGPTPPGERIWLGPMPQAWLGQKILSCDYPSRLLDTGLIELDCAPEFWNNTPNESVAHRLRFFEFLKTLANYADYSKVRPLVKRPKGWPPTSKPPLANENA